MARNSSDWLTIALAQDASAEHARNSASYALAVTTLSNAGIFIQADGQERYAAQRSAWEPLVRRKTSDSAELDWTSRAKEAVLGTHRRPFQARPLFTPLA